MSFVCAGISGIVVNSNYLSSSSCCLSSAGHFRSYERLAYRNHLSYNVPGSLLGKCGHVEWPVTRK